MQCRSFLDTVAIEVNPGLRNLEPVKRRGKACRVRAHIAPFVGRAIGATQNQVVARATLQIVATGTADQGVVTGVAAERVAIGCALQGVVEIRAAHILGLRPQICRGVNGRCPVVVQHDFGLDGQRIAAIAAGARRKLDALHIHQQIGSCAAIGRRQHVTHLQPKHRAGAGVRSADHGVGGGGGGAAYFHQHALDLIALTAALIAHHVLGFPWISGGGFNLHTAVDGVIAAATINLVAHRAAQEQIVGKGAGDVVARDLYVAVGPGVDAIHLRQVDLHVRKLQALHMGQGVDAIANFGGNLVGRGI